MSRVYPRVGGGNHWAGEFSFTAAGLSPRGRGKPPRRQKQHIALGSIPAWAGETGHGRRDWVHSEVYPRVGGGNAAAVGIHEGAQGLSPRGRGKHRPTANTRIVRGSIPAWAGETATASPHQRRSAVYPRVGGGN